MLTSHRAVNGSRGSLGAGPPPTVMGHTHAMLELGPPMADYPKGEGRSRPGLPNDDAEFFRSPMVDARWHGRHTPQLVGTVDEGLLHPEGDPDLGVGQSLHLPGLVVDPCQIKCGGALGAAPRRPGGVGSARGSLPTGGPH